MPVAVAVAPTKGMWAKNLDVGGRMNVWVAGESFVILGYSKKKRGAGL